MEHSLIGRMSVSARILLAAGVLGLLFQYYMQRYHWRNSGYSIPDFSIDFVIRTIITALSVFAILKGLALKRIKETITLTPFQLFSVFLSITLSALFFIFFLIFPDFSDYFAREDGIIEYASFLSLFSGSVVFFVILYRNILRKNGTLFIQVSLFLFAILFFIMAMEEISWGQRLFSLNTPELFQDNTQNEINFHNINTVKFDNLFYTGLCFLFVVLPFIKYYFHDLFSHKCLDLFIPDPFFIIVGSVAFAFHFNKWNLLYTQIWFFFAVFSLLFLSFTQKKVKNNYFFFASALLIILIQVSLLISGENTTVLKTGRIAEYKELLSEIALLIFSIDVYLKDRMLVSQ